MWIKTWEKTTILLLSPKLLYYGFDDAALSCLVAATDVDLSIVIAVEFPRTLVRILMMTWVPVLVPQLTTILPEPWKLRPVQGRHEHLPWCTAWRAASVVSLCC